MRHRLVPLLVAACLAATTTAGPVSADETDPTVPPAPTTTIVEEPSPTTVPVDTTVPETTTTVNGKDQETTTTSTTAPYTPPHEHHDADPEEVPDTVVVPRRPATIQVEGNRAVVASMLASEQARLTELRSELGSATADLVRAEGPLRAAEAELNKLNATEQAAADTLIRIKDQLRERAVSAFVTEGVDVRVEALLSSPDLNAAAARRTLFDVVAAYDTELMARYEAVRSEASLQARQVAEQISTLRYEHEQALARFERLSADVTAAEVSVAVAQTDNPIAVDGFTFPVEPPYNFISSYGFCRDGCNRSHQGNDIFAPMGNDLYAVERGVITNMGFGRLGGWKLWLVGESGTRYYYAHLSGFADGITDGTVVEIGQVIGYVGDTGNAKGTSPHLHFEIHPAHGRGAVDPYPLLRAAADADAEHRAREAAMSTSTSSP